jgi:hypothetical protein
MTMEQQSTDDADRARMSEWFETVSYPDDYAGQLPDVPAEDSADG